MDCIAIIQARMSSSRLPGKVLKNLNGIPMIKHIVDRLGKCKYVDKIIVATSNEYSDDILAEFCNQNHIEIYRGSLKNVFSRFINLIDLLNPKYVVRITGDCPLIYPLFIDKQIKALKKSDSDVVITSYESKLLCGQGVHSSRSLKYIFEKSEDLRDVEHVGSIYLSKSPSEFRSVCLKLPSVFNKNYRITVDEISDLKLMQNLYQDLWDKDTIKFEKALSWLDNNQKISCGNLNVEDSNVNKLVKNNKQRNHITFTKEFNWEEL